MPNLTIRDSLDADMPEITAIYAHHVLHGAASFEIQPPSLDEMARRRADILARGMPYILALFDGAVVGYAYAGPYRSRPAYRDTLENSIYIRHDQARRGVGMQLLPTLIARCETIGARQMIAVVGDSANLPSIRLHERCGFRMIGALRSVGYKHGRWLDSVLLQRTLGAGDTAPPA
jgi:L-amino acid N-acyltransferase YncA